MTLAQVKTLIVGVLKGWFTNKKVLDKFSEDSEGNILYNGKEIDSVCVCEKVEDSAVETAITETIAALNTEDE